MRRLSFLLGVVVGAFGVVFLSFLFAFRGWKQWANPEIDIRTEEPFEIPFEPRTMSGWEFDGSSSDDTGQLVN